MENLIIYTEGQCQKWDCFFNYDDLFYTRVSTTQELLQYIYLCSILRIKCETCDSLWKIILKLKWGMKWRSFRVKLLVEKPGNYLSKQQRRWLRKKVKEILKNPDQFNYWKTLSIL